jgi:hypothetical protein
MGKFPMIQEMNQAMFLVRAELRFLQLFHPEEHEEAIEVLSTITDGSSSLNDRVLVWYCMRDWSDFWQWFGNPVQFQSETMSPKPGPEPPQKKRMTKGEKLALLQKYLAKADLELVVKSGSVDRLCALCLVKDKLT